MLRRAVAKLQASGSGPLHLLKALEPFTPVVAQQLCQAYRRRHIGLSLPLSRQAESLADSLVDLHRTMAGIYEGIYARLAEDGLLDDILLPPALKAAYRAQYHLTQALLLTYESYRAEPAGIWKELHGIHQQARAAGIESQPLPNTAALTIEHGYKHALLLGLSNPYHLPFGAIYKIDRALPAWSRTVTLADRLPHRAGRCVFLIDAAVDIPAVPLLSDCARPKFGDHLFIETMRLAAELQRQVDGAAQEPAEDGGTDIQRLSKIEAVKTLRLLIRRWGSHQIRTAQRSVRHGPCDLAVGTVSVTQALQEPLGEAVEEPTAIILSQDVEHTGFSQHLARHRNVIHVSPDWQIRDSSAQGFRLTFTSSHESRIQVNELVAVKPRYSEEAWLTGLVQWARVDGSKTLEIGVRALARDARPVSVTAYHTWKEARPVSFLALLLPPGGECADAESIIIPRTELFDPALGVLSCVDQHEWMVKLKGLVSAAPSFYWYEIASRTPAAAPAWPGGEPVSARAPVNLAAVGEPY